jgi:hypothetical protein
LVWVVNRSFIERARFGCAEQLVRLAGGWWPVLICSECKVLLAGCWWLVCSERKLLLFGG